MTLRTRVSRLDDYTGELTQALEKLEIEQARGALNRDEQVDFLGDLRVAIENRDLKPLRTHALLSLLIMVIGSLGMLLLPRSLPFHRAAFVGCLGLAILGLLLAAWRVSLYLRRRRVDRRWLAELEARVAGGGTVFDPK